MISRKCSWGQEEPYVLAAPRSRVGWAIQSHHPSPWGMQVWEEDVRLGHWA